MRRRFDRAVRLKVSDGINSVAASSTLLQNQTKASFTKAMPLEQENLSPTRRVELHVHGPVYSGGTKSVCRVATARLRVAKDILAEAEE
jgi:hypothetical protein